MKQEKNPNDPQARKSAPQPFIHNDENMLETKIDSERDQKIERKLMQIYSIEESQQLPDEL